VSMIAAADLDAVVIDGGADAGLLASYRAAGVSVEVA
jgi:hypothetical protein